MTRRALAPAPSKKPRDRKPPPKPSPEARRAALARILAEVLLDEMLRGTWSPGDAPEVP